MSSTSRTQVVDVTYDDHRTGERVRERKIQEVPYEEIEQIRGQELALFRPPVARPRRDDREYYDRRAYDDNYYSARPPPRDRLAPPLYDDRYARRSADRQRDRRRDDYRDRRRRDDSSDSSSDSSRERRRRRRHRRAKSEQGGSSHRNNNDEDEDDDGGRLWWSNKPRKEGNWRERNFDSSYDGLIAAAAGAAIGGLTAKYFAGDEKKNWKIAGGAIAGGTAFNLAENKYRLYTEEREEEKEAERVKRGRGKHAADEEGFVGPMELGGHLLAGTAP